MTDHPPPEDSEAAIHFEDFDDSPAPFHAVINRHRPVFIRVFELLNDLENEQKLIDASNHNRPALEGILDNIHIENVIVALFNSPDGDQLRRTFGHVICRKMRRLSWRPLRSVRCRSNPFFRNGTIFEHNR